MTETTSRPRKVHGLTAQQEDAMRVLWRSTKTKPAFVGHTTAAPLKSGESRPGRLVRSDTGEPLREIHGPWPGSVAYRVAASLVDLGLAEYLDGRSKLAATKEGRALRRKFES